MVSWVSTPWAQLQGGTCFNSSHNLPVVPWLLDFCSYWCSRFLQCVQHSPSKLWGRFWIVVNGNRWNLTNTAMMHRLGTHVPWSLGLESMTESTRRCWVWKCSNWSMGLLGSVWVHTSIRRNKHDRWRRQLMSEWIHETRNSLGKVLLLVSSFLTLCLPRFE